MGQNPPDNVEKAVWEHYWGSTTWCKGDKSEAITTNGEILVPND